MSPRGKRQRYRHIIALRCDDATLLRLEKYRSDRFGEGAEYVPWRVVVERLLREASI